MEKNKKVLSYIRWILSFVAIIIVWRMINVNKVYILLSSLNFHYLLLALSLSFLIRMSISYRWSLLLKAQGYHVSKTRLLKIIVISDALGIFLPSNLSREGIKAFMLWKFIGKGADSFTSVVIDRFSGLYALAGIALACSLISFQTLNNWKVVALIGVLFAVCIVADLMIPILHNSLIHKKFASLKIPYMNNLSSKLSSVLESLANFKKHKHTMIKVKGVAVLIQFSRIFYIFFMSLALGINIPFIHFCVFLPIIMLLLMLPISVGGIGVQEAAFIYFFVPLGMEKEEAVSLSLLCYTAVILWLLVGWVIYAKEGIGGRKGALREINTNGYAN